MKKATSHIVVICCSICVALLCVAALIAFSRYRTTTVEEFNANVRLHLYASDRYDPAKTVFYLVFSTVGETVWPRRDTRLVLIVDGAEEQLPGGWGNSVVRDHILSGHPRSVSWWMTLPELTAWLGPGDHELRIEFGAVKSNVLKVSIPAEGRATYEPELDMSTWKKVR